MDIEQALSSEIPSLCHIEKKRRKKKKNLEKGMDIEENGCSLVPSADVEATASEVASENGRKKRKRKKTSDNLETVPKPSDATDSDLGAEITLVKKEKKKKIKSSDNDGMKTVDDERTTHEPVVEVTLGKEKKKKRKKSSKSSDVVVDESELLGPIEAESAIVEPEADVTLGKEKRKKKSKRSDVVETTNLDKESTEKKVAKKSTKGTTSGPGDEGTLGKKVLKKEEDKTSNAEQETVYISLDPIVDVTSEKKKRKKKSRTISDVLETITVENKSTVLVPTEAEDISVGCAKKKKKREKKVSTVENQEMAVVDSETVVSGKLTDDGHESQESLVNVERATDSEKLVLESIGSQDSAQTSKNKRTKKKSESQNHPDIDQEIQNDPTLVTIVKEKEVPSGTDSEKPCADLSSSNTKKRKRKKKIVQDEGNDADGSTLHGSEKSSIEVVESSLPLVNSKDLVKNIADLATQDSLTIEAQSADHLSKGVSDKCTNDAEVGLDLESDKVITYKRKKRSTDLEVKKSYDVIDTEGNVSQVPETVPEKTLATQSRKKLLILDVNGILVDFVNYNPREYKYDITISKKYVFKRPHCDEFIRFCLERFTVAVWSSRMKWNMEKVIDFLFGDSRKNLLFCWDQSHCTMTGFNTVDNQSKPLVLKEIKNVWNKVEPGLLYEKGDYDETNTLLLDDSPYKALCNPANTAIFPNSYSFTDRDDKSLAPGGSLRTYLEGLLLADNVQEYVRQNPYGQPAIIESNVSWSFYEKVIDATKKPSNLCKT